MASIGFIGLFPALLAGLLYYSQYTVHVSVKFVTMLYRSRKQKTENRFTDVRRPTTHYPVRQ